MDQLRIMMLAWLASAKDALRPRGDAERGDVPDWVLITLMTVTLVVLIWGVASQRLVEILDHVMDSLSSI